jgi:formyl-CoA transferase
MGAFALSAALYRSASDPGFSGEWIDLALFEGLFRLIEWQVIVQDQLGAVPERAGNRLPVAPAAVINTFRTANEEWITVTSATQRSVRNIVEMLGLPMEDYNTVPAQIERRDILDAEMATWIASRSTDVCLSELSKAGVVASRIFSAADILEDDVYRELGDIVTVDDPDLGAVRMQGVIPRLSSHPGKVWRTGPALGEDNADVLHRWLGLGQAEVDALADRGVIGRERPRVAEAVE